MGPAGTGGAGRRWTNDEDDDDGRRAGVPPAGTRRVDARRDPLDATADALPGRALPGTVQARLRRGPAPVRVAARVPRCRVFERLSLLPAAAGRRARACGLAPAARGLGR